MWGAVVGGALGLAGMIGQMNTKLPSFEEAPNAPSMGDINSAAQNTELWNQYKNYSNLGSNYYRTAGQGLRTQMQGMIPSMTNLMGMSRKAGMGSGFSSMMANQQRNDMFSKAGAQANQGLLGLYNQGQDRGMSALGSAYNMGMGQQKMKHERDMTNYDNKQTHRYNEYQKKMGAWNSLSSLGGSMMGMSLSNSAAKSAAGLQMAHQKALLNPSTYDATMQNYNDGISKGASWWENLTRTF